jgi:hypothetical protein
MEEDKVVMFPKLCNEVEKDKPENWQPNSLKNLIIDSYLGDQVRIWSAGSALRPINILKD